jgi:hypothetical protein
MEGLFKKLWMAVSDDIQQLVDKFSLHLIEQNMNNQEDNFWSFDSTMMAGYRYFNNSFMSSLIQSSTETDQIQLSISMLTLSNGN